MSVNPIKPYQGLSRTANGASIGLAFKIDATSELDAESQLTSYGVYRLAVLTDPYGNSPDPLIKCRSIDIDAQTPARVGGQIGVYIAHAFYSSEVIEPEPDGVAIWECEPSVQEQETDVDAAGDPLLNSANEPIAGARKPVANEVHVGRFIRTSMTYFQAAAWSRLFNGRCNSLAWQGADPKEVLCHTLKPRLRSDGNIDFEIRVEFKDTFFISGVEIAGWRFAQIQRGRRKKTLSSGSAVFGDNGEPIYTNILDANGKVVQEPVLLDATGQPLPSGATPVYFVKDLIKTVDFTQLGNL